MFKQIKNKRHDQMSTGRNLNVLTGCKVFAKNKLNSALGIIIAASIAPVMAQAEMVIEEIVVTAQKRAESSQDIPVAITAVTGETLENMGVQSFGDLTRASSSLTIQESNNKNESPISLRGIGTYSFSIGTEASVAVVIDDIPVARSGAAFANLVDIERVEVLRGPQSTLFGKSASAGVINIVTKAPSEELEGSIELLATDDNEYRGVGSVSGMVSDTVGVRLSGYYGDREGHLKNLTDGKQVHGEESYGFRGKLVADLSDVLTATAIAEYNQSESDCCAFTYRSVPTGTTIFGQPVVGPGITPSKTNKSLRVDAPLQSDTTDWMTSLKLDYEMGDYTLTSITGYRDWEYDWAIDVDGIDTLTINQGGPYVSELLTQELRIASPASETFEYVAGLYYAKSENSRSFDRGPIALSSWTGTADSELLALFGQSKIGLADNLALIAGVRVQTEEVSTTFLDHRASRSCSDGCAGSDDDSVVTGKLALQYFVNDDVMVFGGWSRGYKGQSYDITSSFTQETADKPVAPEESDAFEVGVKSTLLDGRLQLNVVAFTTEYTDFQATSSVSDSLGNVAFKLNNVGELETSGVEIDGLALISENFTVNFGIAAIDATIKSFKGADCFAHQAILAPAGCVEVAPGVSVQDLSGEDLANSPDLKVTLGGDLTIPMENSSYDGFVNFSYQWQDEVNFNLLRSPLAVQDAYGIFNLSVGINEKDDRYRVTLFAHNLFDQDYVTSISDSNFFTQPIQQQQVPRGAERYLGLRLKYNFR